MWQSLTLAERIEHLGNQRGQLLLLSLGSDVTLFLLMQIFGSDKHLWLSGYEDADIGCPLIVALDDITDVLVDHPAAVSAR